MNSGLTVLARFRCSFAVSLMVLKSASGWQQSATCVLVELKQGEFQHGKYGHYSLFSVSGTPLGLG